MTDFRALCAELLSVFYDYDDESNLVGIFGDMKANGNDLLDRARAALTEPEPEVAGPTDEELDRLEHPHWEETGVEEWGRREAIFNHRSYARAVLARWGRQPAPPAEGEQRHPTPVPVAEGEVAELVAWLRGSNWNSKRQTLATRAADLLEQRHPAPVPVSEHPWKRDWWCDDEDRCWCFNQWDLQWELECYTTGAHWCDWMLPATALPLPQGEVQP